MSSLTKNKVVIIPELLSLISNVEFLPQFALGPFMYPFLKSKTRLNFTFHVVNDITKPSDLNIDFKYFWGKNFTNTVYYEHPLLGKYKLKMLIKKITMIFIFLSIIFISKL